jgi:predicted  nucleic acid-binding Zn-ribbon protein
MSTLDPAHEPVRRYLAALAEIDRAIAGLAAAHGAVRETLQGFDDVLREVPDAPTPAPAALLSTGTLWRPSDPARLTGLTDLYEVVGRFTFEGDDGSNVAAMRQLVEAIRAEVERQRASLSDLARLPALAETHAASLDAKEHASAHTQRTELLQQFEPAATTLREVAQKLLGALQAEKKPDLSNLDSAEADYQHYVARMQGLYGKALPFLREQLAELCRLAGVEVPPSWPETLPFAPTLPPHLVAAPPAETPQLATARQTLDAIKAREDELSRAIDELGVQLRRCQGELEALAQRETKALEEIQTARAVLRWATKLDELDATRQTAATLAAEVQARTQAQLRLRVEVQRINAALVALQKDATEWAQGLAAKEQALTEQRKNEPALFGRDEWRRRLDECEAEVDELRTELTRKQQQIQALQSELAQLQGRDQAEQTALVTLARQQKDVEARDATLQQEVAALEQELGAARPPRRLTVAQAEESLAATQAARSDVRARVERVGNEMRRIREDIDRATVQLRQTQSDREKQAEVVSAALHRATSAHEEALRSLASRRQAAFERHTQQVLSELEASLTRVDSVFVEPARRALLLRGGMTSGASNRLREQAAALAQALAETTRRVEAIFTTELARIERVEQDFLARVPEAFRHLWD